MIHVINLLKISMVIAIGVLTYIFVIDNEVLKDKSSVLIQETKSYPTQLKRERPDLYLKNIENKTIKAVEKSEDQLFEFRAEHDLLTSRFKSDLAKRDSLKVKLERLKKNIESIDEQLLTADNNKALSLKTELTSMESKIKLLLLEELSLNNSIATLQSNINKSFSRLETAGMINAKLQNFLTNVKNELSSAKIFNKEILGGVNSKGYSEMQNLMTEVKVLAEFMEKNSQSLLEDNLYVEGYENIDSIYNEFMGAENSHNKITP